MSVHDDAHQVSDTSDAPPPSPERPVYAKVREEDSRSFFAITCDEGWRSMIVCTSMYEWAADWLLGILGRRPFASSREAGPSGRVTP